MKRNPFILILYVVGVFSSCDKRSDNSFPGDSKFMVVKEYKTNIRVPQVGIRLYKCSRYDNVFGCQATAVFATRSTDQNGEYTFTNNEFRQATEGIILTKSLYWDIGGGTGERFMQPEATVHLSLKASKSYPDSSMVGLIVTSELGTQSILHFRAPKDSTVHYRLFGNERNSINWIVYKGLVCYLYCSSDTLARGSLDVSPQKFETIHSSINY